MYIYYIQARAEQQTVYCIVQFRLLLHIQSCGTCAKVQRTGMNAGIKFKKS